MDAKKRKKLESKGWRLGDASDFLNLSPEETAYIEMKFVLGQNLKKQREKKNLTQIALAQVIGTSQSRVAKMEAGDASVTLDLLIRALLALGLGQKQLARMIGAYTLPKAA